MWKVDNVKKRKKWMWRNNIVENFFEGKCGNIVIEKFWKNYM